MSNSQATNLRQLFVQFRVQQRQVLIDIPVQHQREHRRHSIDRRVPHHQPSLVQCNGRKVENRRKYRLHNRYYQTTMNDELGQLRRTPVGVAPVPEQEFGEMRKLGDRKVSREGCLFAFFAYDTNADVCSLDHAHVVATISDTADSFLGESTNQASHICFLSWGATAGYDSRQLGSDFDELVLEQIQAKLLVGDNVSMLNREGGQPNDEPAETRHQ